MFRLWFLPTVIGSGILLWLVLDEQTQEAHTATHFHYCVKVLQSKTVGTTFLPVYILQSWWSGMQPFLNPHLEPIQHFRYQ